MTNEERIALADQIAREAHEGQVDKAGRPYIEHPRAVETQMATPAQKVVALLHDTLEDTDVTAEDLRRQFGDGVADAVRTLTRRSGEDYFDYIRRVKELPLARKVKLADLRHNMDLTRLPRVTDEDLRRVEKYKEAAAMLAYTQEEQAREAALKDLLARADETWSRDRAQAMELFRQAAEKGSKRARKLAVLTDALTAKAIQDVRTAERLLREAADLGSAQAVFELGSLFLESDPWEAYRLMGKAAHLGYGKAAEVVRDAEGWAMQQRKELMGEMSSCCGSSADCCEHSGDDCCGVSQLENWTKAAKLGSAEAARALAEHYDEDGGAPDMALARKWFAIAADLGDDEAAVEAAYLALEEEEPDTVAVTALLRRAADGGCGPAATLLGVLFENGRGGKPVNHLTAARWYRRAVDLGDADGMIDLAALYHSGRGVAQDDGQAKALLHRAAATGHPLARHHLKTWYGEGV